MFLFTIRLQNNQRIDVTDFVLIYIRSNEYHVLLKTFFFNMKTSPHICVVQAFAKLNHSIYST